MWGGGQASSFLGFLVWGRILEVMVGEGAAVVGCHYLKFCRIVKIWVLSWVSK